MTKSRGRVARLISILLMSVMVGACTIFDSANGNLWVIDDAAAPTFLDTGLVIGGSEQSTGFFLWGISVALVADGNGNAIDGNFLAQLGLTQSTNCGRTWMTTAPTQIADVSVSRSVFAPAGVDYLRYIDTFTNNSISPRQITALWFGIPAIVQSMAPPIVAGTSDGDTNIENSDTFVVTTANQASNPAGPSEGPPLGFALRNAADVTFLGEAFGAPVPLTTRNSPTNSPLRLSRTQSLIQQVYPRIDGAMADGALTHPLISGVMGNRLFSEAQPEFLAYSYRFALLPGQTLSLAYFVYQGKAEDTTGSPNCGTPGNPPCSGTEINKAKLAMADLVANPDFRCVSAQERARIINWPSSFNGVLQDDTVGNTLLLNTLTGNYQFTLCNFNGLTISGAGTIRVRGCYLTLEDARPDRRVVVRINTCSQTGTASIEIYSLGRTFTISDRNLGNNTMNCPANQNGL